MNSPSNSSSKKSSEISAYDIITSIEGSIALTECSQRKDNSDTLNEPSNLKQSCNLAESCTKTFMDVNKQIFY